MSFAEELKLKASDKVTDHAISFAEEIEQKLKDSAELGYRGFSIPLKDRDDAHILKNEKFIEDLKLLLEGCEVKIEKKEYTNLFFKNKYYETSLVINW